jgi:hypothetical protein
MGGNHGLGRFRRHSFVSSGTHSRWHLIGSFAIGIVILAALLAAKVYRESLTELIGIILAFVLVGFGAMISFLQDFWEEYEAFCGKEADWAGYVESAEKQRGREVMMLRANTSDTSIPKA